MKPELNHKNKDAFFRVGRFVLSALLAILCANLRAVAQDEPLYFHLKSGITLHTHLISVRDSSILIYRGSHTTYSMIQDTVNIEELSLRDIDSVTRRASRSSKTSSGALVGGILGCVIGVGIAALSTESYGDAGALSVFQNIFLVIAGVGGAVVGALIGAAAANTGANHGSAIYIEHGDRASLRRHALIQGEEPYFLKRSVPGRDADNTHL